MIHKTLNNYSSELQSFRISNGHYFERYVLDLIKKQLRNCSIINPYNDTYDLILDYKNYTYNIEVKSCAKWFNLKNGNLRNSYFRLKNNDVIDNNIHIFAFCIYWNKLKEISFVKGNSIRYFFEKKKEVITKVISINQIKKNLNPKNLIIDIMNKIKIYELK